MLGMIKVFDGVQIMFELIKELFSCINLIFYQFVDVIGQINLIMQDFVLLMGDFIKELGDGSGVLELIEMKVKLGGFVCMLVEVGGLGDVDELLVVKFVGGDFEVIEGCIVYDEFMMIFLIEFDVKFYGLVVFDDMFDLVVLLLIWVDLLVKLGVGGDV